MVDRGLGTAGEELTMVHADLSLVLEDQWHPQP